MSERKYPDCQPGLACRNTAYIEQLEAELSEAKAEAKKFKVISGVVGSEISRKLDQIKHWLEEVDKQGTTP